MKKNMLSKKEYMELLVNNIKADGFDYTLKRNSITIKTPYIRKKLKRNSEYKIFKITEPSEKTSFERYYYTMIGICAINDFIERNQPDTLLMNLAAYRYHLLSCDTKRLIDTISMSNSTVDIDFLAHSQNCKLEFAESEFNTYDWDEYEKSAKETIERIYEVANAAVSNKTDELITKKDEILPKVMFYRFSENEFEEQRKEVPYFRLNNMNFGFKALFNFGNVYFPVTESRLINNEIINNAGITLDELITASEDNFKNCNVAFLPVGRNDTAIVRDFNKYMKGKILNRAIIRDTNVLNSDRCYLIFSETEIDWIFASSTIRNRLHNLIMEDYYLVYNNPFTVTIYPKAEVHIDLLKEKLKERKKKYIEDYPNEITDEIYLCSNGSLSRV